MPPSRGLEAVDRATSTVLRDLENTLTGEAFTSLW